MIERWAPVIGYEGQYDVSDCGRVKSLTRTVTRPPCGRSDKPSTTIYHEKILRPRKHTAGYWIVQLSKGGLGRDYLIHRLVAAAFVPGAGEVVRHLDGDPSNAHYSNLAWGSFQDNEADKAKHGRVPRGAHHPNAKLDAQVAASIRDLANSGLPHSVIAERFNISRYAVYSIAKGMTWRV